MGVVFKSSLFFLFCLSSFGVFLTLFSKGIETDEHPNTRIRDPSRIFELQDNLSFKEVAVPNEVNITAKNSENSSQKTFSQSIYDMFSIAKHRETKFLTPYFICQGIHVSFSIGIFGI